MFDGVHTGHKFEFEQASNYAQAHDLRTVIVTFDIDPDEKFIEGFKKLMTNKQRICKLENFCDCVIVLNFEQIKNVESTEFLNKFFGICTPASIHVGKNFRFGAKAAGSDNTLKN